MKDFDAALDAPEPFVVGGQTFMPRKNVPHLTYLRKLRELRSGDNQTDYDTKLIDFMSALVVKGDRDRLRDLLSADDEDSDGVTDGQMRELVTWLMELNSGKPKTNSGSSTTGLATTGELSSQESLPPVAES